MGRTFPLIPFAFLLAAASVRAETLPLPAGLIALDTPEGEALLLGAEARRDYFPLAMHFVTQVNPAFCGPAPKSNLGTLSK